MKNSQKKVLNRRWLLVSDKTNSDSLVTLAKSISGTEVKTLNGKTYVRFQVSAPFHKKISHHYIGTMLSTLDRDREKKGSTHYCAIMLKSE